MSSGSAPSSTAELLAALRELKAQSGKYKKSVSTSTHLYPASIYAPHSANKPDRRITSWKLTEHMFFISPSPFPVLARGLFTELDEVSGEERIVARGYDKFFNTNEVDWTYWSDMARYTDGPYHLTLKTNGCLILVSALSETEIVVASKHSLGTTTEEAVAPPTSIPDTAEQAESSRAVQDRQDKAAAVEKAKASARKAEEEHEALLKQFAEASLVENDAGETERAGPSRNAVKKANKVVDNARQRVNKAIAELNKAQAGKDPSRRNGQQLDGEEEDHRQSLQHAEAGRQWVRKMLSAKGLKEADLAKRLWDKSWSAVFELCDDDFEEHVIATPANQVGLNLHGLNHNTPTFETEEPAAVAAFAEEFGFIPTPYFTLPTLLAVKEYTDKVAETGAWKGDMIEGFVVRSRVRAIPREASDSEVASVAAVTQSNDKKKRTDHGQPPYAAGAPFFFKVKFEEPYLLYRTFREITRALMPLTLPAEKREHLKGDAHPLKKLGKMLQRPEAQLYAQWCEERMLKDPEFFQNYDRGVIRVRDAFLRWTEDEGKDKWVAAKAGAVLAKPVESSIAEKRAAMESLKQDKPVKWVIVPVAIPGCGKTMIGVSLAKLFKVAHTQCDDVTTKRTAPTFLTNIAKLLLDNDAVYADRNNHLDKHYAELVDLNNRKELANFNIKMLALVWDVDDLPYHRALRLCSERVVSRGDNHQTLRADLTLKAEHEAVVAQFLRNFTPPSDGVFSRSGAVPVQSDPRDSVQRVVEHVLAIPELQLQQPSADAMRDAVDAALGYIITTPRREIAKIAKAPRYFGVAPEIDLEALVRSALDAYPSSEASAFFEQLVADKRITPRPHITLIHEKTVADEVAAGGPGPSSQLWAACESMQSDPQLPLYTFDMSNLIWDGRAMTLSVENLRAADGQKAPALEIDADLTRSLHVTVGTASEEIPAFESRALVRAVREAKANSQELPVGISSLLVQGLKGEGRVRGMS